MSAWMEPGQSARPTSREAPIVPQDDLLWRHLRTVPAFRALLRAVEARFYRQLQLPGPILDVGCGDGHFALMTFDAPLTVGIDPWWGPLQKAHRSGAYQTVLQSSGGRLPFADHAFATAISNSVLEHIPEVDSVLAEVSRVLQPGGRLVITMPGRRFTDHLGGAMWLTRMGLPGLADRYRALFNRISRHVHTDPAEVWCARLAAAGLRVEQWQPYFSPAALHALELGHVQGLPAAIMHAVTGHWIVAPWDSSLGPTERWLRPYYQEPFHPDGAYLFFLARKEADAPLAAALPPAQPFRVAEMTDVHRPTPPPSPGAGPAPLPPVETKLPDAGPQTAPAVPESPAPPAPTGRALLGLFSLTLALVGQLQLNANPAAPVRGLFWFLLSALSLTLALGAPRRPWPPLSRLSLAGLRGWPPRRWLTVAALLAAALAARLSAAGSGDAWPLLFWLSGIGLALFAWFDPGPVPWPPAIPGRRGWLTGLALLALAFVPRAVGLTTLPFILNGTEASIGLDLLPLLDGRQLGPFATGWLTNPTLPYRLLAIPIRLLGPTVLALRFWSPLAGAVTVVAVWWVGRRLWGRSVGLAAAVLLAGAQMHLHYSRLGLTNVWDPLLVLLAVGAAARAWRRPSDRGRRLAWLWAGVVAGLNAYFFTASRLLPWLLLFLLAWAWWWQRPRWRRQWRHMLAASVVALVVALPQLLYYVANPALFWERWQALGILAGQTGWLGAEATRTGQSQLALWRQQLWQVAMAFNGAVDRSPSFRPQTTLLSFGQGLLFMLGLLLAVTRLRQLRSAALVGWVVLTMLGGGALLLEPPQSHRLLVAAPALALLAAIALVALARGLAPALWPRARQEGESGGRRAAMTAAVVLVAALLALSDVASYFGRYPTRGRFGDRNTEIADRMASYLDELGESWTAYFYGPPAMYVSFPTIPYLAHEFRAGANLFDVPPPPEDTLSPAQTPNRVFVFLPERLAELDDVRAAFPGGKRRDFPGRYANPLFITYEVQP